MPKALAPNPNCWNDPAYPPSPASAHKFEVKLKKITLMGRRGKVKWQMREDGLSLIAPDEKMDNVAVVFKMETE